MISVFFHTVAFRNILGNMFLTFRKYLNKCKSYVENKSDLLFIGTRLRFSSLRIFTKNDFQVSQGSVETLFRWGGKRLQHFVANLFRTLCTKFYQNWPTFVENMTKTFWLTFFLWHGVYTVEWSWLFQIKYVYIEHLVTWVTTTQSRQQLSCSDYLSSVTSLISVFTVQSVL